MCRSIKVLRRSQVVTTDDEVRAAALQFVRKISGSRVPPKGNAAAFDAAVEEITRASLALLQALPEKRAVSAATTARPRQQAALR